MGAGRCPVSPGKLRLGARQRGTARPDHCLQRVGGPHLSYCWAEYPHPRGAWTKKAHGGPALGPHLSHGIHPPAQSLDISETAATSVGTPSLGQEALFKWSRKRCRPLCSSPPPPHVPLALFPGCRSRKLGCASLQWDGEDLKLGLLWGSILPAAMRTPPPPRTPGPAWARFGSGPCHQAGSWACRGLQGPLAEGAAHSCGLPVLGKQKGWHKDPSPMTSWRPGPGKEWVESPSALAGRASQSQPLVPC